MSATTFASRSKEEFETVISGMDYVDLYIYHFWDKNTPIVEIVKGLHKLIQEGKVKCMGISHCYAYQLVQCNAIAKEYGWEEFIFVQRHYNLIFSE